uniref:Uncharacterized protein n=1 Tax=Anguilla anguilla TaxID=7936 RepID=A0A0E9VGN0_ANGAN
MKCILKINAKGRICDSFVCLAEIISEWSF